MIVYPQKQKMGLFYTEANKENDAQNKLFSRNLQLYAPPIGTCMFLYQL